jgi:hypothetical protein
VFTRKARLETMSNKIKSLNNEEKKKLLTSEKPRKKKKERSFF